MARVSLSSILHEKKETIRQEDIVFCARVTISSGFGDFGIASLVQT
jgi:hypothetical protein